MKIKLYQLPTAIQNAGFRLFTSPYSMNLVSIRNTEDPQSNTFNDVTAIFYYDEIGQLLGHVCKSTVDAGLYYREHPANVDGTAILVADMQYEQAYRLQENGHKGYKAFRQVNAMRYIRDNDEDDKLDFWKTLQPKYHVEEIALTNLHHAGESSTIVEKWSAGCTVIGSLDDWFRLVGIADIQEMHGLGTFFTYTVFNQFTFNRLIA